MIKSSLEFISIYMYDISDQRLIRTDCVKSILIRTDCVNQYTLLLSTVQSVTSQVQSCLT